MKVVGSHGTEMMSQKHWLNKNVLDQKDIIPTFNRFNIHPGRLTWNRIMEVWKIIFLSKWVMCMFHVNLPGCSLLMNRGF